MVEEVFAILKRADCVCFDVDSTVIQEESIDELAKFCGKGSEVAKLTTEAMSGSVPFHEALTLRLNIIQPTIGQVQDFIQTNSPTLTPGVETLVDVLHRRKVPVYLISGGFKSVIIPIADQLKISHSHIFANRLKFYFTGEYAGFDENQPTSQTGGKGLVIQHLKQTNGYKNVVLIGDGVTDLEASPPADIFIGYGGNIVRDVVKTKAKWFVIEFDEICNVLVA